MFYSSTPAKSGVHDRPGAHAGRVNTMQSASVRRSDAAKTANLFRPRSATLAMVLRTTLVAIVTLFAMLMQPVQAEEPKTLRIGGTGAALGGMHLLTKAFMSSHPGIHVVVLPSLGSGGGIKALLAGKIDIAVSARPLKDAEQAGDINASEYARTPLVFATRHDTPAVGVTLEQLAPVYAGNSNAWPDGAQLRLVMRPANESDNKVLCDLSEQMKEAVLVATERAELHVAITDQDNASALEKIQGSLGLISLGQMLTEGRKIRPLTLNGVTGTVATVNDGRYPWFKKLFLVVRDEPASLADAFARFVRSSEAQAILAAKGHLVTGAPVDPNT